MDRKTLIVLEVEELPDLTIEELSEATLTDISFIKKLVEHGILDPEGSDIDNWRFNLEELKRIRKILRLQKDLKVNLEGAAVIIDLMDQIERMETKLAIFEKHFFLNKT